MGPSCNPNVAVMLEGRSLAMGAKKLSMSWWTVKDASDRENGDARSNLFLDDDPWKCDASDSHGDCPVRRADAVFVAAVRGEWRAAEGSVSQRLHAVCAAYALTAVTNMPTLALWPADRHLPATTFRHLFRLAGDPAPSPSSSRARGESGREGSVWVQDTPAEAGMLRRALKGRRRVAFKPCKNSTDGQSASGLPFKVFLSPAVREKSTGPLRVDAFAFEREVDTCLAAIRPSAAVAAMVVEEDLARVAASSAVLVDVSAPPSFPFPHFRCPPPFPCTPPFPLHTGNNGTSLLLALFTHQHLTQGVCSGCTANSNRSAPHCTMRRVTMEYLYDPAVSFTAGGLNTSDLTVLSSYFSPLRTPLVLKSTQQRNASCRVGGVEGREEGEGERRELVESGEEDRVVSGVNGSVVAAGGGAGLVVQRGADRALGAHVTRCSQLQVSCHAPGRTVLRDLVSGGNDVRDQGSSDLSSGSLTQLPLSVCFTILELFTLSFARGLLAVNRSSLEARFVTAQGRARSASFGVHRSVCESVELRPITKQKWAMFTQVEGKMSPTALRAAHQCSHLTTFSKRCMDPHQLSPCISYPTQPFSLLSQCRAPHAPLLKIQSSSAPLIMPVPYPLPFFLAFFPCAPLTEKLKLVVCTMPKVAANSWLMWLRAMLGQPHPEDPILALDPRRSGWHMLTLHFTEQQAVQQVTRPDFFKFTFVRNPFSRVLSAYSNKLVITDAPNNKTGPGSREYWNEVRHMVHARCRESWNEQFFKYIRPHWEKVKGKDDLVSFPDFVKLVAKLMQNHRWRMDRHIASQSDICFMDKIKYDFVGRFENLEEDAKYVVNRFGGDHLDIFNFGVNAHQTRADEKLAKKYDKETYELVKRVFARDLHIPLNNITQQAPSVLVEMFETK
ncbi:unnamed protein product [Closterium sp. Naga37s-1]|nr:unnamed protein product [Closterium sp. Naga37s-1]